MSLSDIRNPFLRKSLIVLTLPVILFLAILLGTYIGVRDALLYILSALPDSWKGKD